MSSLFGLLYSRDAYVTVNFSVLQLPILVHELLSIEVWREKVYPELVNLDFVSKSSMAAYMVVRKRCSCGQLYLYTANVNKCEKWYVCTLKRMPFTLIWSARTFSHTHFRVSCIVLPRRHCSDAARSGALQQRSSWRTGWFSYWSRWLLSPAHGVVELNVRILFRFDIWIKSVSMLKCNYRIECTFCLEYVTPWICSYSNVYTWFAKLCTQTRCKQSTCIAYILMQDGWSRGRTGIWRTAQR